MAGFVPVGSTPVAAVPAGSGVIYSPDPGALVTQGYAPTVSAVTSNAHRYLMLFVRLPTNSALTGMTEVELRETPGGPDISASAVVTINHPQDGAGSNVTDNNLGTYCQQDPGVGAWWIFDFGAKKDIREVVIWPEHVAANRTPGEFDIRVSDTNVEADFVTKWSCSYTAWVAGTPITFTMPASTGAAQRWRLRPLTTHEAGGAFGLREVQLRTAAGGANQATGGTASARTEFSGSFVAANAFDGNNATEYASGGSSGNHWLAYDLGAGNDLDIVEVTQLGRAGSPWRQIANGGYVEAGQDGRSWINRWTFANKAAAVDYLLEVTRPDQIIYPPGGARRFWAFRPTANGGGVAIQFAEIAFLPTSGGADQTGSGVAIGTAPGVTAVALAFDNSTASDYQSANFTDKVAYDFGVASTVTRVDAVLLTGSVVNATYTPTAGDVLLSDDNETWVLVSQLTAAGGWTLGGTQEIANPTAYPKILMF